MSDNKRLCKTGPRPAQRVGVDYDWKTSAETEDEIMATISKHAAEAHPTIELTPELVETVRQAIKER